MSNNNVNKTRQCPTCSRAFASKQALANHRLAVHGNNNPSGGRIGRNGKSSGTNNVNYDGTTNYAPFNMPGSRLSRADGANGIKEAVAQIVGSTPEGRAWAFAALHPCGAGEVVTRNVGVVNGMCDTMTSAVATPVYRSETHISYSQTMFENKPESPTTYGVDIIIPPIPEIDFCYRLLDDSTNTKTAWVVVRLPDFQLPEPSNYDSGYAGYNETTTFTTMASVGYGKCRQIGVGHTIDLDAAGLNNQGRIVVGQMEGQWRWTPLAPPRVDTQKADFVTDSTTTPPTKAKAVTEVEALGTDMSCGVWCLEIPTTPATIVSNCPNAYQGTAKEGAYIVSKFTSPLLGYAFKRTGSPGVFRSGADEDHAEGLIVEPYMPVTAFSIDTSEKKNTDLTTADSFFSLNGRVPQWSAFGNGELPIAGFSKRATALAQYTLHPGISEPSDMMVGVAMIRNIPAGGSNGITASLRIKSRNYYECISNGTNAAVAPYVHPPAQFDFQALNSVIIAGKQLADGYPASANSFSTILSNVWGALKQYVRPIANTIGGLDIPVASGIARMLDKGVGYGTDLESHLAKKGFGASLF